VIEKVVEELGEVRNAPDDVSRSQELGDLLFSLVNLSRWYGVDAESALRAANARFQKRFSYIEASARARGRELTTMSVEELDAIWDEAKGKQ